MSLRYYQVAGIVATGVGLTLWAFERSTLPPPATLADKANALATPLPPPLPPFIPASSPPEAPPPPAKVETRQPIRVEPVAASSPASPPGAGTEPPTQAVPEPTIRIPSDLGRRVVTESAPPTTTWPSPYSQEPDWLVDDEPEPGMESEYAYEETPVEQAGPSPIPDPFEAGF